MPMPHRTFAQVAKRRLQGTEGAERVRTINGLIAELPDYRNGPYADLRKWLQSELARTRVRAKTIHRDSIAVRREGAAQIALVGAPNAGKSSLLQALSEIQIKTGDYAFTTLRPVSALTEIRGVPVQLVEIPGLIEGAAEGRGGGKALLGVLRCADAIVFCQAVDAQLGALRTVRDELVTAGIAKPALLAVTKLDEAPRGLLRHLGDELTDLPVIGVSVLDDASLDSLRAAIWDLTGLIRVFVGRAGEPDGAPVPLRPGATVLELADTIHHDLAAACTGAKIWGSSARFPGQRVGRAHTVADEDIVEVLARRRRV